MAVFTNDEVKKVLDTVFGVATYPDYTAGVEVRVVSAVGTDSTAGTAISGAPVVDTTFTAVTSGQRTISGPSAGAGISFTAMPASTVAAVDIYNTAGTVRRAYGALQGGSKTVAAGDTLTFAQNSITVGIG